MRQATLTFMFNRAINSVKLSIVAAQLLLSLQNSSHAYLQESSPYLRSDN